MTPYHFIPTHPGTKSDQQAPSSTFGREKIQQRLHQGKGEGAAACFFLARNIGKVMHTHYDTIGGGQRGVPAADWITGYAADVGGGDLKGLSHEILTFFWLEWIYLCLNIFIEIPSILDIQFKYLCVSYQPFSEILCISEKDWQPSLQFSNFPFSVLVVLQETLQRVSILLRDSTNLREWLTTNSAVLQECSSTT
jgi:hypothetical protein